MEKKEFFVFYFIDSNNKVTTKAILQETYYYLYDYDKLYDLSGIDTIWFSTKTDYPNWTLKMIWDLERKGTISLLELINSDEDNMNYELINAMNLYYEYHFKDTWKTYYNFLREKKNFIKLSTLINVDEQNVTFWRQKLHL